MNLRAAFFIAFLLAASGIGYGTEIELSNTRNPFEFGKKKVLKKVRKQKKAEVKVDLIMIKGKVKIAIIGDKSYKVGDIIEGNRIISISLNHVELATQTGTKRLYLK